MFSFWSETSLVLFLFCNAGDLTTVLTCVGLCSTSEPHRSDVLCVPVLHAISVAVCFLFLKQDLAMQPRLTLNSLCSLG